MRYLKNVGKADLCLSVDDIELLEQLRAFLTPFKVFILLASECSEFVSSAIYSLKKLRVYVRCKLLTEQQLLVLIVYLSKKTNMLVAKNLNKRLPITHLTKVSVCFDPAVMNAVLSRDECSRFILKAFHELSTFNEDLFKYVIHLTTSQKVQEIELSCHSQSQS